jgi:hypothetical protein
VERQERGDEARLRELERRRRELKLQLLEYEPGGVRLKHHPNSMLPGGVTYVTGMTTGVGFAPQRELERVERELAETRARMDANTVRLHHERVEQDLNAIRQKLADMRVEVSPPAPVRAKERTVLGLQRAYPPHGNPPKGTVWKDADRKLRAFGTKTSRGTYFAALKHIRARTTSDQS